MYPKVLLVFFVSQEGKEKKKNSLLFFLFTAIWINVVKSTALESQIWQGSSHGLRLT